MSKLAYAFTWLTNKNGETKELDIPLPMRDIVRDVQATANELYSLRRDLNSDIIMDTAITLVEKQSGVDLSALRIFLSYAHVDKSGDINKPVIMNCCDELIDEEE